jgi:hypothetical protein
MAAVRDRKVIITGGESVSRATRGLAHKEVEALDVASGHWVTLPPLNEGRHGSGTAFIGDTLYVAAGCAVKGGKKEINSMEKLVFPPVAK